MRKKLRPVEGLVREFIGAYVLESHEDVIILLHPFDFAPKLQFVNTVIFIHDLDMRQFEFHSTFRANLPLIDVQSRTQGVKQPQLLLHSQHVHLISFKYKLIIS